MSRLASVVLASCVLVTVHQIVTNSTAREVLVCHVVILVAAKWFVVASIA